MISDGGGRNHIMEGNDVFEADPTQRPLPSVTRLYYLARLRG